MTRQNRIHRWCCLLEQERKWCVRENQRTEDYILTHRKRILERIEELKKELENAEGRSNNNT